MNDRSGTVLCLAAQLDQQSRLFLYPEQPPFCRSSRCIVFRQLCNLRVGQLVHRTAQLAVDIVRAAAIAESMQLVAQVGFRHSLEKRRGRPRGMRIVEGRAGADAAHRVAITHEANLICIKDLMIADGHSGGLLKRAANCHFGRGIHVQAHFDSDRRF